MKPGLGSVDLGKPDFGNVPFALVRAIAGFIAQCCDACRCINGTDREKPINVPLIIIESVQSAPWASATFVGQTLRLTLRFEGDATAIDAVVADLRPMLGEAEICVPGFIVADIRLASARRCARIKTQSASRLVFEALTIKD